MAVIFIALFHAARPTEKLSWEEVWVIAASGKHKAADDNTKGIISVQSTLNLILA